MAQEDFFFSLAQMFLQGQKDSVDTQMEMKAKEEEKRRYDEGASMRAAQLESVQSNTAANKAQTERIGVETEGARQQNKFAVEDRPLDREDRVNRVAAGAARRKLEEHNASDPYLARQDRKQQLEIDAEDLLVRSRQAAFDEASDPELKAARKTGALADTAEKVDRAKLVRGQVEEFFTGADRRERSAQRNEDMEIDKHLARMTPEQQKRVNEASVAAAEIDAIARIQGVETNRVQQAASILEVMQRSNIITGANRKELSGAVGKMLEGKAQIALMSKDPAAGENFVRESAKLLTLTAALEKQDPQEAAYQAQVLARVRTMLDQQVEAGEIAPATWAKRWVATIADKNRDLKLLVAGDAPASRGTALDQVVQPGGSVDQSTSQSGTGSWVERYQDALRKADEASQDKRFDDVKKWEAVAARIDDQENPNSAGGLSRAAKTRKDLADGARSDDAYGRVVAQGRKAFGTKEDPTDVSYRRSAAMAIQAATQKQRKGIEDAYKKATGRLPNDLADLAEFIVAKRFPGVDFDKSIANAGEDSVLGKIFANPKDKALSLKQTVEDFGK